MHRQTNKLLVNDKINSLVIYDIVNDKQRIQFAKFMESYGVRVQKSAFEVRLNRRKMERMIMEIKNYVNNEDNVRLYKIYEKDDIKCWGKAHMLTNEEYIII